jgi:hypothetical protein
VSILSFCWGDCGVFGGSTFREKGFLGGRLDLASNRFGGLIGVSSSEDSFICLIFCRGDCGVFGGSRFRAKDFLGGRLDLASNRFGGLIGVSSSEDSFICATDCCSCRHLFSGRNRLCAHMGGSSSDTKLASSVDRMSNVEVRS